MSKLRILELFGGIGACSKALERLGIDYEIADYVEIDKYAVRSFNAIHNTNFEPQDICEWNKDVKVDLIMHGSPCQDFSLAGLQAGGDEGSGTRSSLMYETLRIVEKLKPKYVIWENVKNMISKKHKHNFDNYITRMYELGYTSYYQVLNAKDYGIPQNRERVFTVSILNSGSSKDISFKFPPKQELKLKLKDILEDEVDEKYYLTDSMINYLENGKYKSSKVSSKLKQTENGICPTLDTMQGGNVQNGMIQTLTTSGGNERGVVLRSKCKRLESLVEKTEFEEGKVLNMDLYNQTTNENISQTLTNPCHNTQRLFDGLRIRKISPKEAWRLMGFDDTDFEKVVQVNSNTQLYKQAGNSIVVNVLEAILTNLLLEPVTTSQKIIEGQTTIFDYIGDSNE